MPIGLSDDHEELRRSTAALLAAVCPPSAVREVLDAEAEKLPGLWGALAEQGWFALAVPEAAGGVGLSPLDLCVVVEEAGRACVPGPVLPTMVAALLAAGAGGAPGPLAEHLTGLLDGSTVAGLGLTPELVLGGGVADVVLVCAGSDLRVTAGGSSRPRQSLDTTRRLSSRTDAAGEVAAGLAQRARDLVTLLLSAEACGIAGWALDTAVAHAKTRVQFGRPIGQFQAVKHACANLLVGLEQARAAVWDAARALDTTAGAEAALALAVAETLAVEHAVTATKTCVQLLGGIGYTWEHEAHIYLKRALSVRALLGADEGVRRVATLVAGGARRTLDVDLPPEAESSRAEVRAAAEEAKSLQGEERLDFLIAGGWISPHWPAPHGRDASPVEQLVIDAEFRSARVRRPHLNIGGWVLPTLIAHGTPEQQDRFIGPTLRGDVRWCQLFSEPGAGSDLAALTTRATRVDGGWSVTGQKVWTSLARESTHAILLARTSAPADGDRHAGISYFVLDMTTPGIDIRPLRELTGLEMFNEVFLDEVFIPEDGLVGAVGDGWRLARTTLANERVSMASGSSFGAGVESLLTLAGDALPAERLGAVVTEAQSLALMRHRSTLRALAGGQPGPESSVTKLLGAEHDQRVQELGLTLLGPEGATVEGPASSWSFGFLATRCLTIAGGTSEVQRNVIAERLLGLPKDP